MVGSHGSFNIFLVLLSFVISACGSFTALVLARESAKVSRQERLPWVAWSAVIMGGIGVWAMHFVGMMAWHTDMPVNYDIQLTILSMALAIVSTGIGFAIVGLGSRNVLSILFAGIFMGAGVGSMHYMGMRAMQMPADISYNPPLVIVSFVIAVSASCIALWMAFSLTSRWQMVIAAAVAALAVCGMHYSGMYAINMVHNVEMAEPLPTALSPLVVASGLFMLSLLVLIVGLALTRESVVRGVPARA